MSDSELRPEARALIEETRDAYAPSASARARAHWALERRLSTARHPSGPWRHLRRALVGGALLATAGAAAAAVYLAARDGRELAALPADTPSLVQGSSLAQGASAPRGAKAAPTDPSDAAPDANGGEAASAPRVTSEGAAAEASEVTVRPGAAPATAQRAQDAKDRSKRALASLEGEIELLRQVNALREAGSAGRALAMLDAYEKANGPGPLGQERAAARTLCLCALGRSARSQDAAARFAKSYPKSPQLPRVRAACGLEP